MNRTFYGAIDIGGTKTSTAVFDGEKNLLSIQTFSTCGYSCHDLVLQCREKLELQCKDINANVNDIQALGVASPGPLDLNSGTVVHIPTLGWRNEPLRAYFEQAFNRRIVVQNDTNAAALGEYVFGGGKGYPVIVYITVSTGIGCGIVIDGEIFRGAADAAGELGHTKMVKDGRACGCGGRGCLEAYASGTSISTIASEIIGKKIHAKEVFQMAREGHPEMTAVVLNAGEMLGAAISYLYQIVDPSVVIIGGSVTNDFDVLGPLILSAAEKNVQPHPLRTIRIIKSELKGHQVLMGAVCLAMQ